MKSVLLKFSLIKWGFLKRAEAVEVNLPLFMFHDMILYLETCFYFSLISARVIKPLMVLLAMFVASAWTMKL